MFLPSLRIIWSFVSLISPLPIKGVNATPQSTFVHKVGQCVILQTSMCNVWLWKKSAGNQPTQIEPRMTFNVFQNVQIWWLYIRMKRHDIQLQSVYSMQKFESMNYNQNINPSAIFQNLSQQERVKCETLRQMFHILPWFKGEHTK